MFCCNAELSSQLFHYFRRISETVNRYKTFSNLLKVLRFSDSEIQIFDMVRAVTHPDKHLWKGSSRVLGHIDGRNDPVSLLTAQPIGGGASLVSTWEHDDSGIGVVIVVGS